MNTISYLVRKKLTQRFVPVMYCLILSLIGLQHPLSGQPTPVPMTSLNQTQADSVRGYWRLKTLVTTRSTLVQFFGPDQQLLYQELLPEKWVKLTRRNQHQFDRLLRQLMANQLLAARIRTQPLPASIVPLQLPPVNESVGGAQNDPSMSGAIHAYINQAGKLRVIVDNPQCQRYVVELVNELGWPLYQEFTNHRQYRRWLDVSGLGTGPCRLVVRFNGQPVTYQLKHRTAQPLYQLQPVIISQR